MLGTLFYTSSAHLPACKLVLRSSATIPKHCSDVRTCSVSPCCSWHRETHGLENQAISLPAGVVAGAAQQRRYADGFSQVRGRCVCFRALLPCCLQLQQMMRSWSALRIAFHLLPSGVHCLPHQRQAPIGRVSSIKIYRVFQQFRSVSKAGAAVP